MPIIYFLLLSILSANASVDAVDAEDLFEKTWPRANSSCSANKKRIELFIRGGSKFTESRERGFGEYVLYRIEDKIEVFSFSKSQSSLYRFYAATAGSSCSKTQGYPLQEDRFAILIGEENRPHMEKLIIQIFDFKTMKPLETIETNLLVEKTYNRPGGFVFKTVTERFDMDMGKVKIGKDKFTYQDRVFPMWRFFNGKTIEVDSTTTFMKLPWKKYFKDEAEFLKEAAWDTSTKEFKNQIVYYAAQKGLKKKCVLFKDKRVKLDGSEGWHCL